MSKAYLIPSFIGNEIVEQNFPPYNTQAINQVEVFVVERAKTARSFLKAINYNKNFDEVNFIEISKHQSQDWLTILTPLVVQKKVIGIISEAGSPCIADPGYIVVQALQQLSVQIIPLIGPSSIFLALAASGLNGQTFTFHGYLPIDKKEKLKKIKSIELQAINNYAQIFMETPYRNNQLFDDLLKICTPTTWLCLATDITLPSQSIVTKTIAAWQKNKPNLNKKPTIFILGK